MALFLNEPHSAAAVDWYAREKDELVAAAWCIGDPARRADSMPLLQDAGHLERAPVVGVLGKPALPACSLAASATR